MAEGRTGMVDLEKELSCSVRVSVVEVCGGEGRGGVRSPQDHNVILKSRRLSAREITDPRHDMANFTI